MAVFKKNSRVVPEPIAYGEHEFRSQYVPGITLRCLARRFGLAITLKGEDLAVRTPTKADLDTLWHHSEQAYAAIKAFHQTGKIHGDLHLENIMIAPGRAVIVDMESSRPSNGKEDENADFMNLKSFAKKLIATGATPQRHSPLREMVMVGSGRGLALPEMTKAPGMRAGRGSF